MFSNIIRSLYTLPSLPLAGTHLHPRRPPSPNHRTQTGDGPPPPARRAARPCPPPPPPPRPRPRRRARRRRQPPPRPRGGREAGRRGRGLCRPLGGARWRSGPRNWGSGACAWSGWVGKGSGPVNLIAAHNPCGWAEVAVINDQPSSRPCACSPTRLLVAPSHRHLCGGSRQPAAEVVHRGSALHAQPVAPCGCTLCPILWCTPSQATQTPDRKDLISAATAGGRRVCASRGRLTWRWRRRGSRGQCSSGCHGGCT
jgi:hypothetical protein